MTGCPSFAGSGMTGISAALRAVDCQTGEATSFAFGHLFGADGRLAAALTILLTLYVALFAIGLLTGRTRIGVASLTPRMMTLGLVLTFATSWVAYQNVVWTLASGAPDEIATLVTGSHGSATTAFADRLDRLFANVTDAADQASRPAPATETGITPATPMVGGFTAATVLGLSSLMLLLGTVGVLVTAKIALAAVLALGPLFIVLALFRGTRGLFEGWLKAVVLFACVPLFAVLIGGGAVIAMEPVASAIAAEGAQPSSRAVGVLFLGASVYLILMAMAIKTATTLVVGWRLPGRREEAGRGTSSLQPAAPATAEQRAASPVRSLHSSDERVRSIVSALPAPLQLGGAGRSGSDANRPRSAQIIPIGGSAPQKSTQVHRAQGIGSRFRPRPVALPKEQIS